MGSSNWERHMRLSPASNPIFRASNCNVIAGFALASAFVKVGVLCGPFVTLLAVCLGLFLFCCGGHAYSGSQSADNILSAGYGVPMGPGDAAPATAKMMQIKP